MELSTLRAMDSGVEMSAMEEVKEHPMVELSPESEPILGKTHAPCISRRWIMLVLLSSGITISYITRVFFSITVEAMQDEFSWSEFQKSILLSSYSWGYVMGQFPSVLLTQQYGGKLVFGVAVLLPSVLTCFSPFCTSSPVMWCLMRALAGLASAPTFPAAYTLLPFWTPQLEKSVMMAFFTSGIYLGDIIGFGTTGVMTTEPSLGWRGAFYLVAASGILWWMVWVKLAAETPSQDSCMSLNEREYLDREVALDTVTEARLLARSKQLQDEESLSSPWLELSTDKESVSDASETGSAQRAFGSRKRLPLVSILTHPASLTLFLNHYAYCWLRFFMIAELPSYLSQDLGFDLASTGLLCIAPYFGQWSMSLASGMVANWLIASCAWPARTVRQVMNQVGLLVPALLIVLAGYSTHATQAVLYLSLAMTFFGCTSAAIPPNFVEISPRYSGTLYTISNFLGCSAGITSPLITSFAIHQWGRNGWRFMFGLTALQNVVSICLWFVFQTSDIVPLINTPA